MLIFVSGCINMEIQQNLLDTEVRMKQYDRFAVCLRKLLKQKNVSVTELSRLMGFKSRNSLFRIVNDQTSSETEAAFLSAMKEKKALDLSGQEWDSLQRALEISRDGLSSYMAQQAIRHLLIGSDGVQEAEERHSIGEIIDGFRHCGEIRMVLCNCCRAALMKEVHDCLEALPSSTVREVRHYIHACSDTLAQSIAAARPLLFCHWYTPLLMAPAGQMCERDLLLRGSAFSITGVDARGDVLRRQYLMLDENDLRPISLEDSDYLIPESLVEGMQGSLIPLKEEGFGPPAMETYLKYTEHYRQLEKNRPIYSLKPDIPINFIHPDLLESAVRDGFHAMGLVNDEQADAMVRAFYDVHYKRWNNFATKNRVTHTVFSRKAMERFAVTGRQSDHFFGMRAYTPDERRSILLQLRELQVNNPYFNVYFLRHSDGMDPAEITLYDGMGVLMTQPGTSYDLNGSHAEVFITDEGFTRRFRNFFLHDLLDRHVMGAAETLAVLDELIRMIP